jgi:hypothetical protein
MVVLMLVALVVRIVVFIVTHLADLPVHEIEKSSAMPPALMFDRLSNGVVDSVAFCPLIQPFEIGIAASAALGRASSGV